MLADETREEAAPGGRQLHPNPPAVGRIAAPPDESRGRAPVDEPHGALVRHLQSVGEVGHGRRLLPETPHEEEQGILAGRDAGASG